MFREMRRKDRELGSEEVSRILNEGEYGVLGTVGEDGYPYTVPLSYAYVDGAIYFHCALEGHKLDNIGYQDKVSFCVVGKTHLLPAEFTTNYESVVVFGRAAVVDGDERRKGFMAILKKYAPEYEKEGMAYIAKDGERAKIVKITVEKASGKGRKG